MPERIAHPSLGVSGTGAGAVHLLVEVKAEAEVTQQGNALWAAADGMLGMLAGSNGLLAMPIEIIAMRMVQALHAGIGDEAVPAARSATQD